MRKCSRLCQIAVAISSVLSGATIENQVSTLALKHWFNDDIALNVTGRYYDSKVRDYGSFITDAPDALDGLGGSHELMVGVNYDYTTFNSAVSGTIPIGELDLAHPDYNLAYGSTPETLVTQIQLRQAEQNVDTTSHRVTHRIGLSYDLTDNLTAYTAYSTGFRGAFNFVGMETPKPETSRNNEVGLKLDQKNLGLSGTLALFQQTRRNVATADPNPDLALYGYTVQTASQWTHCGTLSHPGWHGERPGFWCRDHRCQRASLPYLIPSLFPAMRWSMRKPPTILTAIPSAVRCEPDRCQGMGQLRVSGATGGDPGSATLCLSVSVCSLLRKFNMIDNDMPAMPDHVMPDMGPEMNSVPWMGNEEIAMLVYPGMTVMDLVGPHCMFGSMMGQRFILWRKRLNRLPVMPV